MRKNLLSLDTPTYFLTFHYIENGTEATPQVLTVRYETL